MSAATAADVPDEVLRSALEFAVGIAAASAKLRPPVPFPPELKRFLRFQKLPPAALTQVRAAVEGDDDFRKRLGSVATEELIDPIGIVWLTRPDNWASAISDMLPYKVVDDEAAFRREERRRLAAQEAATRGRAELLGLTAELERERAAKTALTTERDRLRSELNEVRARLRDAQRAEHATAQSLVKTQSDLAAARSLVAEPVAPPPPVIDAMAVRALIDGAVSASTDAMRMLTDALGELADVDSRVEPDRLKSVHQRRPPRKQVRLPGGVLAGSVEAAEFLLRVKGAEILVDGYNVAKLGWPGLELDQQRQQCTAAAENLAKRWNIGMTVVFDGASIEGAHASSRRHVRIVYSPKGVSADDLLRAEVAGVDTAKPVVVVTNDRAIITDVAAAGANTIASDDFLVLVRR